MLSFDEFKKLDLRVARILTAEKIPDAENLLKLKIDIGGEQRQIVAGIAKFYTPESLVGKQIVVVANLEPKTFRGVESQGMALAADAAEPVLLIPDKEVKPGSKIC